MEFIDILDTNGNKTGQSKPKPDIHRDGDWHRSVHIWILNSKGELLLQHRSKTMDSYPDMWDISSAGHISSGENSMSTALRELKEELGLNITPDKLIYIGEVTQQVVLNNNSYFNNEFNDIYLLKMELDSASLKMEDGEVSEVKWLPWKDVRELVEKKDGNLVPHDDEFKILFQYLENEK